jgi:hypothetical protein
MLTISLKESVIIGAVTVLCAILIQIVVKIYGEDEIKTSNIFYKHKKSVKFYSLLFFIGILIHCFVKYIEFDEWFCKKICTNEGCKVICELPFNNFTNLLITV